MRFVAIDLSQLPPPQLIDIISFEAVLAAAKSYVQDVWAVLRARRPDLPALDTLDLESEPIAIVLQALAYRETLLRALVNDKARAVLLAYAVGTDLDHLGAFYGVQRMAAGSVVEDDTRLRQRIQLAPEAFSTAGARGAYEFHALTLSLDIVDAHAFSPADGRVTVVLAGAGGADVSDAVMLRVIERFAREDTVPLTDIVTVVRAAVVIVPVTAQLFIPRGPDPMLIKTASETAISAHMAQRYRIGSEVFRAGLIAAAKVAGVDNVILGDPVADVVCGDTEIATRGALTVTTTII
jgi:phage-related baseplate assembly protein